MTNKKKYYVKNEDFTLIDKNTFKVFTNNEPAKIFIGEIDPITNFKVIIPEDKNLFAEDEFDTPDELNLLPENDDDISTQIINYDYSKGLPHDREINVRFSYKGDFNFDRDENSGRYEGINLDEIFSYKLCFKDGNNKPVEKSNTFQIDFKG
jgi:hypothetical protein